MARFFVNSIDDNGVFLTPEDTKHIIKVLRMRVGDTLTLCDGCGTDCDCEITSIGEQVDLKILRKYKNESEPSAKIVLYQCLPKGDKLDFIIQKAVELGVCEIVPVLSRFCVAKNSKSDFSKKLPRYQKIALEAAKQSGRGIIPVVSNLLTFDEAVTLQKETALIFYEGGGEFVHSLVGSNATNISVFVGSEGGFSSEEIDLATKNGIKRATLGKLILRCETAPIAGITLVLNAIGAM